jgi:hypothetical protein
MSYKTWWTATSSSIRRFTDNEAFGRMLFDFLFDRTLEEIC